MPTAMDDLTKLAVVFHGKLTKLKMPKRGDGAPDGLFAFFDEDRASAFDKFEYTDEPAGGAFESSKGEEDHRAACFALKRGIEWGGEAGWNSKFEYFEADGGLAGVWEYVAVTVYQGPGDAPCMAATRPLAGDAAAGPNSRFAQVFMCTGNGGARVRATDEVIGARMRDWVRDMYGWLEDGEGGDIAPEITDSEAVRLP